jgi:hypothetical protein
VKIRAIGSVLVFAGLLSACGSEQSSGNTRVTPGIVTSIHKGATTREQVRTLLGPPQSVKTQLPIAQPPGLQPLPARRTASEIWAYWISRDSKPGIASKLLNSAKPRHKSITILIYFDANGIVLDSQVEEGQT